MPEQSSDQYINSLERRFGMQKKLRVAIMHTVLTALVFTGSEGAHIIYSEIHKNDALPHD